MTTGLDDTVLVPPRPVRPDHPAGEAPDDAPTVVRVASPADSIDAVDSDAGLGSAVGTDSDDAPEPEPDTAAEPEGEPEPRETGFAAFRIRGETVLLDAPCVLGRNPHAPRVPLSRPPRYVRVPSPEREVSSSHVSIEHVGQTVVVTDLKSTNGTVITLPGRGPRTLRPGESVVATAGTLVDIGDGNLITILPIQRAHDGDADASD